MYVFAVHTGYSVVFAVRLYEPLMAVDCPDDVAHPLNVFPALTKLPVFPSRLIKPFPVRADGALPLSEPVVEYVNVYDVELFETSCAVNASV